MRPIRPEKLSELVVSNGQRLQPRTSEKLAIIHQAFLMAIDEARAASPVASIDFATIIRVARGLGVRLTYQHINARASWPHVLRPVLVTKAIGRMEGPVEIVVERVLVGGGDVAVLRALSFGRDARVIDVRVGAADLASQQDTAAALLKPFQARWIMERGLRVLDATSGFPVDHHPLRQLAENVEVAARVPPNDLSPRPRRIGALPALRRTIFEVVHMTPERLEEVGDPGERNEILTLAGLDPMVPILCRPNVPTKPGESAGAARKARARLLAELELSLSQGRYAVDRCVIDFFTARENAIAIENMELLRACMLECQ